MFIQKLTNKLKGTNLYPFEDNVSSNIFLSSVFTNGIVLAILLILTHFILDRGIALEWFYGSSQVFGLLISIIFYIKWRKEKRLNKLNKDELEKLNTKVGFIFYWIIGLVISSIIMMIPFSIIKLLF